MAHPSRLSTEKTTQSPSPATSNTQATAQVTTQDSSPGVLSQTLNTSPSIKWVLPARIRSPLLNDIVFVGQCSIHLREFSSNGQLTEPVATLELGEHILAARVISAKAHTVALPDAILESGRDEVRFTIDGEPCDDSQPPQIVVLSTTASELVYLYAHVLPSGGSRFVYARKRLLGGISLPEKYAKHLAIDPE